MTILNLILKEIRDLSILKSASMLVLLALTTTSVMMHADSSKASKKIALLDTLNPELASLPEKEKKRIVGDGVRFSQTIVWRPNTIEASLEKITGIKAKLDKRLKEFANTPRQEGEKSEAEMLHESRTLGHVINLIKNHQAGNLDLNDLQKELGIKQSIHQGKETKRLLKIAKK